MDEVSLRDILRDRGYGVDTEIEEDLFEDSSSELQESSRTVVNRIYPDARVYRDDRRFSSVHLTDYRGMEREEMQSDVIVAHLELFNPEHHPVLHSLIDTPVWFLRNRVFRKSDL